LHLPFPDLEQPACWERARAETLEARGRTVVIARQVCALFERFWSLVGMENALLGLAAEPELSAAVLARIAEWQVAVAEQYIRIGVDAARISDDYGSQADLLMAPATWRGLIRPHLARLVELYQAAGLPVILHSCGNLARIMDDLVELGFAAFNIQTSANDLAALKRRYGRRLCIWGGLSTQTTFGTGSAGSIRQAVRQAIAELGNDGLLILEPDQVIEVPEEDLQAFSAAAQELIHSFNRGGWPEVERGTA
jgi:uroporphyrinogen decarboxylase